MPGVNYNQTYAQIKTGLQAKLQIGTNAPIPFTELHTVMTEVNNPQHGTNPGARKKRFTDLVGLIRPHTLPKVIAVVNLLNQDGGLSEVQKIVNYYGDGARFRRNPLDAPVQQWLNTNHTTKENVERIVGVVTANGGLADVRTIAQWFSSRTIPLNPNGTNLLAFVNGLPNKETTLDLALQTVDKINVDIGKSWLANGPLPPGLNWANITLQNRTISTGAIGFDWIDATILSSQTNRSRSKKRYCENLAVAFLDLGLFRDMSTFDTTQMQNVNVMIIR